MDRFLPNRVQERQLFKATVVQSAFTLQSTRIFQVQPEPVAVGIGRGLAYASVARKSDPWLQYL
jgi:hypothetical protein